MRTDDAEPMRLTVVHVIPFDQPRGAQRYARALRDVLNSRGGTHQLLTLFAGDGSGLDADIELNVPRGRLRRFGVDPRVVWRLRSALRRLKPDIVVAHGGEPAKYLALATPRSTKLVYLKIGVEHPKMTRAVSGLAYRFYVGRADAIVAVSETAADEVAALTPSVADRVRVIPNGRDPEVFRPPPRDDVDGPVHLVWIGEVDRTKRPEWFIAAVGALRSGGRDIAASLIGDGPRLAELSAPARDSGVELKGRRDDVPEILARSDLLVFTGEPPEGMPGVLIEAGMCGVPVVSTRVPGADDVVDPGLTGELVALDDFDGLLSAMERLVDDRSTREEMGLEARRHCLERFSLEATAARWDEVFNDLMTTAGSTG